MCSSSHGPTVPQLLHNRSRICLLSYSTSAMTCRNTQCQRGRTDSNPRLAGPLGFAVEIKVIFHVCGGSGFTLSDLILLSESVRAGDWVQCTCMCSQQPAVLEGWPLWTDTRRQQEGKTPFQQEVKNPDQGWDVRKESIRKEDVSSCAINVQEVTAVQPSK